MYRGVFFCGKGFTPCWGLVGKIFSRDGLPGDRKNGWETTLLEFCRIA